MSDDPTSSSPLGTFGTENENIAEAVHEKGWARDEYHEI
jgi:hypothetical protein